MKREALVVGINQYPSHTNLSTPAKDAEQVAKLLKEYGEFEVYRLPNKQGERLVDPDGLVKQQHLEDAINRLFSTKDGKIPDTAVLYFAGHGLLKEDEDGKEVFLATGETRPGKERGITIKKLQEILANSQVRQQIVWLDCCHSGALMTDLGEVHKGRDRCFITACREFETATGEVLTKALLEALDPIEKENKLVTNYTLEDFIKQKLEHTPQHPVIRNDGEIILTGKDGVLSKICPYKGLEYFDFNPEEPKKAIDPRYFYGRTQLTNQLLEKVEESNFLAVLGASGSGKSSVVRAGLLYQLYLGEKIPSSNRWKIYKPFTPGEHPLQNLAKVFVDSELSDNARASLFAAQGADGLGQLINNANAERVVLVADQFEEVFTLCQDHSKRQQFFECLMGAVNK
ncbi:hypothetical protein DP117_24040 [Brasilonema sp. UFV-L1]|nr:hypothetical protein [Brasilonema sp. UFV-L1]